MKYDVYDYEEFLGTVELKDAKLVITGPHRVELEVMMTDLNKTPEEAMKLLPELMRGVMHLRPPGSSNILYEEG